MHNGSTQWNVVHNEAVLLTEMAAIAHTTMHTTYYAKSVE